MTHEQSKISKTQEFHLIQRFEAFEADPDASTSRAAADLLDEFKSDAGSDAETLTSSSDDDLGEFKY